MRRRSGVLAFGAGLAAVAVIAQAPGWGSGHAPSAAKQRVARAGARFDLHQAAGKRLPAMSGGAYAAYQEARGLTVRGAASSAGALGVSAGTLGCGQRNTDGDVRVNQDCTFRRQSETAIAVDPRRPSNIVAGQNDSRVGFNQCGIDYSNDGGRRWGDLLPPFRQRLNSPSDAAPHTIVGGTGTFHTYDVGSDPAVAMDSRGRAFFSCVAFDVATWASMVYVTASPPHAHGSYFFNVGGSLGGGSDYIADEENSPAASLDKEFIVADSYADSPNRDNVYVTFTRFVLTDQGDFLQSPIYASMSTDHARTWSRPEVISGVSRTLCVGGDKFDPHLNPHACNNDQGSDPEVLPNGDLAVVFNNANTPDANAQQLAVHCHPTGSSTAGTARLNCGAPARVGADVIVGEPLCDFGRGPEECVPGTWVRTNDFPRLGVNPRTGALYAVWQDYRNGRYDIQLARSTDGGATWSASVTVNHDRRRDHYMPDVDAAGRGHVAVTYTQTGRVPHENETPSGGFAPGMPGVQDRLSVQVAATGHELAVPYAATVVSPRFVPPDGIQAGFLGDYNSIAIARHTAHVIWSDTRNRAREASQNGVVRDEDAFTTSVRLR